MSPADSSPRSQPGQAGAASAEPDAAETGRSTFPAWSVDPSATWWDDVWPFADETAARPGPPAEPEPEPRPEPRPEADPDTEPEPEPAWGAEPEPAWDAEPEPTWDAEPAWEAEPDWDAEPELAAEPEPAWETVPTPGLVTTPVVVTTPAPKRIGRARRWTAVVLVAAVAAGGGAVALWLATQRTGGDQAELTGSQAFQAPQHLGRDSALVRSEVLPSGDLLVTHWIRSPRAVHQVTIRTPHVLGLDPATVHVGEVVLAADGVLSPVVARPGEGQVTLRVPAAHRLYLRYRLSGVVRHTGPDGRALARITSAGVQTGSRPATTTRTVVGATVLALACSPPVPQAVAAPCGSHRQGSWQVRLGRAEAADRVMAQLQLS